MGLSFHWIPARHGERAEEHLNAFLRRVRVLSIEKHFCGLGGETGWAVCIEYAEANDRSGLAAKGATIDYREVLDEADFRVFSALRKARKKLAEAEGVPAYAIVTNEQLAQMVRKRCKTLADIQAIEGIGAGRMEKYGEVLLKVMLGASRNEPGKEQEG